MHGRQKKARMYLMKTPTLQRRYFRPVLRLADILQKWIDSRMEFADGFFANLRLEESSRFVNMYMTSPAYSFSEPLFRLLYSLIRPSWKFPTSSHVFSASVLIDHVHRDENEKQQLVKSIPFRIDALRTETQRTSSMAQMADFGALKCKDFHDHVYGLHSLAIHGTSPSSRLHCLGCEKSPATKFAESVKMKEASHVKRFLCQIYSRAPSDKRTSSDDSIDGGMVEPSARVLGYSESQPRGSSWLLPT